MARSIRFSRKARREISWILLFLSCLSLTYFLVLGDGGILRLRQYQAELGRLQLENRRLLREYRSYQEEIERLKTDPAEIERIARERYNMARSGDIIVNLPREGGSPQ